MNSSESEDIITEKTVQNCNCSEQISSVDLFHEFRLAYRYMRRKINNHRIKKQHLKKILYITTENVPYEYINACQKQYPDKFFEVIQPIIGDLRDYKKTNISCEISLQNKKYESILYKSRKNNVTVYGIYSNFFSNIENRSDFSDIKYLLPFLKSVRILAKKLKPSLIHCEKIPFFIGAEFEKKNYFKVFQTIDDLYYQKTFEPFWAMINSLENKKLEKFCRDNAIKKHIASLYNKQNVNDISNFDKYLKSIYDNYLIYKNVTDNTSADLIFKKLNKRTEKIYSNIFRENSDYNPIIYTLNKANKIGLYSKSYYNNLSKEKLLSKDIDLKNIDKNGYYIDFRTNNTESCLFESINTAFNINDFRQNRLDNKKYIRKELSEERIALNFVDRRLFADDNSKITGYLDTFYPAPLLFFSSNSDIESNGVDIAINTILKLFEMKKNIQIIFNITDGKENPFIDSFIKFLLKNSFLNGRWIYLQGKLNTNHFLAASDIILFPQRKNPTNGILFDAIKLGCIPITSSNGEFKDTITDIMDDMIYGCGFNTDSPIFPWINGFDMYLETTLKALNYYNNNSNIWNQIVKNAISSDISWSFEIIKKYNDIYNDLLK